MRIVLITARYLPHRGGLESVVAHLAQEYIKLGHSVRIVTNRYPRRLPAHEVIDGIQIDRLHFLLPDINYLRRYRLDLWFAGWWYRLATQRALRRIIAEFKPDIINSHYLNEAAEFSGRCLAGAASRTPWIISLHGGDVDGEPYMSAARKERFVRLSRQANHLTACSGFLSAQAQKLETALKDKITVIHNGVDVQRFACASPYTADRPYIFAVGQLAPHKGFDLLIQAFAQVAPAYPQVQLRIAGDGMQRLLLEDLIRDQKLDDRVKLLGKVDEAQVASIMAGSLFIAMPSRREPFGIVALEGMAAGKPVLATPVGGLPEFLPVPPNRLVEPELPDWTQALDEWLGQALDGQLSALGNQDEARRHDWSSVAQQYLRVYQAAAHA